MKITEKVHFNILETIILQFVLQVELSSNVRRIKSRIDSRI